MKKFFGLLAIALCVGIVMCSKPRPPQTATATTTTQQPAQPQKLPEWTKTDTMMEACKRVIAKSGKYGEVRWTRYTVFDQHTVDKRGVHTFKGSNAEAKNVFGNYVTARYSCTVVADRIVNITLEAGR